MNKLLEQNDITAMRNMGIDLAPRWEEIFAGASNSTGFVPNLDSLRKSEWWKTGKIGAVSCHGTIAKDSDEKLAVLKIQGTKPPTSEAKMIQAFEKNNTSSKIRPPKIYAHIPWNEQDQYEILIIEEVQGKPAITNHPGGDEELDNFFALYEEYRTNCRQQTWVRKPINISYRAQVREWLDVVKSKAKNDPLIKSQDEKLAGQAVEIIERSISIKDLEFVHGHFFPEDLIIAENSDVVLFSNLFWSWKIPFYDAVFGYHWWMLGMGSVDGFNEELLEKERQRWFEKIYNLNEVKINLENEKLIDLVLLERAVPALMVDRYMLDSNKPYTKIIVEGARKELDRLVSKLS